MKNLLKTPLSSEDQKQFADERCHLFLDVAPNSLLIINKEGQIIHCNNSVKNQFDYFPEEIIGFPIEILIPDRFRNNHINLRKKYMENPIPRHMANGQKLFGRKKDGSEIPVEVAIAGLKLEDKFYGKAIVSDITEKIKAEFEHDEAIRAKENLIRIIVHDLKNPLTSLLLNIQMAPQLFRTTPEPKILGWIENLKSSAQIMNELINDILELKKTNKDCLENKVCEIGALINTSIELMTPLANQKKIIINKIVPNYPTFVTCNIMCDPNKILQVLFNLISNAIKFSPEGGRIEIRAEREAMNIHACISDNGIGISPNDLVHVFEPFWQAKDSAKLGSGLGLSIVKKIIEDHGGSVGVESKLGQGSKFFFNLPCK